MDRFYASKVVSFGAVFDGFQAFYMPTKNIRQEIDRQVRSRVFILFSEETRRLKLFTEISLLYYPLIHLKTLYRPYFHNSSSSLLNVTCIQSPLNQPTQWSRVLLKGTAITQLSRNSLHFVQLNVRYSRSESPPLYTLLKQLFLVHPSSLSFAIHLILSYLQLRCIISRIM